MNTGIQSLLCSC